MSTNPAGIFTPPKSIPFKIPPKALPIAVVETIDILKSAQFKAYLAGGCVRDLILARTPRDWDIVTDAPLEKIRTLFPRHLEVGVAFGIVKLPPRDDSEKALIDIAIFRKEDTYSDARHPDHIEVGDEITDASRRDFTVNALYLDTDTSTIIDYVQGHKDLQAKLLRTVGEPQKRFGEDALRILRTVRFSAQLGFKIDRPTAAALKTSKEGLNRISRERVREEIFRMLETQRVSLGLEALVQNSLWEYVFGVRKVSLPADLRQFKMSWQPKAIQWLAALAITGLLGNPIEEPEEILERLTEKLKLSNDEKKFLKLVLRAYADSTSKETPSLGHSPIEWVDFARIDPGMFEMAKAFVRRARGPTQEEKDLTIKFLDQVLRWAARQDMEKLWPSAAILQKEGYTEGKQLGSELKKRQWETFWNTKLLF